MNPIGFYGDFADGEFEVQLQRHETQNPKPYPSRTHESRLRFEGFGHRVDGQGLTG